LFSKSPNTNAELNVLAKSGCQTENDVALEKSLEEKKETLKEKVKELGDRFRKSPNTNAEINIPTETEINLCDILVEGHQLMIHHMAIEFSEQLCSLSKNIFECKNVENKKKIEDIFNNIEVLQYDSIFAYEFLFVHYGAIRYFEDQKRQIKEKFEFLATSFTDVDSKIKKLWKETGDHYYIQILYTLHEKHVKHISHAFSTFEDDQYKKTKFVLFTKNNKLFEESKYEYENLLKEIGYVHYGGLQTFNFFRSNYIMK